MPEPISVFPQPKLWYLARPRGPFAAILPSFTSLHYSGRSALYWGFRGLRLATGTVAWMPSFHCGVEVQAAVDAGFEVDFYRINSDLEIDFDDLERRFRRRPGPVLTIHYFGVGQPLIQEVAALCRERGQVMLEDCSHALFSAGPQGALGRCAPISIYSLWKAIPVYEGGALLVNRESLKSTAGIDFEEPQIRRFTARAYMACLKTTIKGLAGEDFSEAIYRVFRREARSAAVLAPVDLRERRRDEGLSALSRRMAASADPAIVVDRRRRNYEVLNGLLQPYDAYEPVFRELSAGASPLCLPIFVARRAELFHLLYSKRIKPFVFGAYAHPRLPEPLARATAPLRDSILGLPVHGELEPDALGRVAGAVGQFLQKEAPQRRAAIRGAIN